MPEAQLPLEINSLEPTWRKQQGCVLHRTHITSVLITHTHTSHQDPYFITYKCIRPRPALTPTAPPCQVTKHTPEA